MRTAPNWFEDTKIKQFAIVSGKSIIAEYRNRNAAFIRLKELNDSSLQVIDRITNRKAKRNGKTERIKLYSLS